MPAAAADPLSAAPFSRRARRGGKRIVVLSRNPNLYSTSRLVAAASEQGHEIRVVDTLHCDIVVEKNRPALLYDGRELDPVDVVIRESAHPSRRTESRSFPSSR